MEKITPFDIPLLNNEICKYLSHKDLARCVLVSKTWAAWFSPALWRVLDCGRRIPDSLTLTRRGEHILVVRAISMEGAAAIREQLSSLHLQRLEFKAYEKKDGIHRAEIRVLPVLERIRTLQHLDITLSLDLDHINQQWIRTLEALPHLESLSLRCERFVEGKTIQKFLQMCDRFERLSLVLQGGVCIEEEDRQGYRDARAAIEKMPAMRLHDLSIFLGFELVEENIFQPLLERCPRMEKLEIGGCDREGSTTLRHLFKSLKENKLPKLRHLRPGSTIRYAQEAFAEALSSVECGMESLVLNEKPSELVVQSFIQYHSRSLTKLDFGHSRMSLWTLSDVMSGLPSLRWFRGAIEEEDEYEDRAIPFDKHWKCVDLKCLFLSMNHGHYSVHYPIGSSGWAESDQKHVLDYVFPEMAKLRSLQKLSIGFNVEDLCLKMHGYLEQLAGLKQLKIFDLASTPHGSIGKQEALWMIKNWPVLSQVHAQYASTIFRGTLQKNRPLVELVRGRFY
ncbi:MAG: hypothetical protein J3Q66DRAFT_330987 [Benniella sp.]|nr:MAG: hypothetical protein J3Q66DRAFT_330987 [Benniella sp.]